MCAAGVSHVTFYTVVVSNATQYRHRHLSLLSATSIQSRLSHPISVKYILILTFQSTPRSSTPSPSFMFPHQNPVFISLLPILAIRPAQHTLIDMVTRIFHHEPMLVTVRYKALVLLAGIAGSNPAESMDVLSCVYCVLCRQWPLNEPITLWGRSTVCVCVCACVCVCVCVCARVVCACACVIVSES